MEILRNGDNLLTGLKNFLESSTSLFIFTPYVKLDTLKRLIDNISSCKTIVVRWEPKDLLLGVSDLEVFEYCKQKNIKLFINSRLHLKAFVDNYERCLFGSANISGRALNIPETKSYNYELAAIANRLSFEDRLYFSTILNEAILITDALYEEIKVQLKEKQADITKEDNFKLDTNTLKKDFLISSLPMSSSVKTLTRVYLERKGIHDEEINCAMHDLALYNIPLGLNECDFINRLKQSFFSHPFILAFINMLQLKGGSIYFGEAKAWIQNNCTNVPTPRRWEITENIQILYKWFKELSEGKFDFDKPNHSERLFIVKDGI